MSLSKLADVSAFIGRFKAGRLSPDMKSEEPPSPNDGPVTIVVGKNFDEVVLGDQDVLVQFYAPWCGHCKRLAPVWQELGVTVKDVPTVTIAKMDGNCSTTLRGSCCPATETPRFAQIQGSTS